MGSPVIAVEQKHNEAENGNTQVKSLKTTLKYNISVNVLSYYPLLNTVYIIIYASVVKNTYPVSPRPCRNITCKKNRNTSLHKQVQAKACQDLAAVFVCS